MTAPYAIWILISAWLVCTGWILSGIHQMNAAGYTVSLFLFAGLVYLFHLRNNLLLVLVPRPCKLLWRFRHPLPLVYFIYLLVALIGGALHAPNNYDALCYRLPRVLHWWSEGAWHWIGAYNLRMDFSATGFEWLMAPILILFKSDRLLFLINSASYILLPGLIYSAFSGLGIAKRVAWCWMWILPCAYCFVLQAGSICNDTFAAVYFLSCIVFSIRSLRCNSWNDAALALLSVGLLTGAKASNIPLLLPLAFILVPLWKILWNRMIPSLIIISIMMAVSFAPIAWSNYRHTKDWFGDPLNSEKIKLTSPLAGVLGNAMEISLGFFEPPLLPMAKYFNSITENLLTQPPLSRIKISYPRFLLSFKEIPMAQGLGMGVGVLIIVTIVSTLFVNDKKILYPNVNAKILGILCFVALLVLMGKLGSESIARLISPYYCGLIAPLLTVNGVEKIVRRKLWIYLAVSLCLFALPSVILSPECPFLPVRSFLSYLEKQKPKSEFISKIKKVYMVYENRNDNLSKLRESITPGSRVIGFAGTSDESEYSLWKPFGNRVVKEVENNILKDKWPPEIDCIVGSEYGFNDRFGISSTLFAKMHHGNLIKEERLTIYASRENENWCLIVPKK
jgi:hypothetical protein